MIVDERVESRRLVEANQSSAELSFRVAGTSCDSAAKAEIEAALAQMGILDAYEGLARESIDLEPQWVDTETDQGEWVATVRYGSQAAPKTGESEFAFDTGGGTQHITQSLGSRKYPLEAPSNGGVIGARPDGGADGVDIVIPVYQFSETHYKPAGEINDTYRGTLFRLTGTVCSGEFRGLDGGECLFLGAAGARRGRGDWAITYRFAGSPNATDLAVGDITGIRKDGWEYLWVRYENRVVGSGEHKVVTAWPKHVYVEQVYRTVSWTDLAI